MPWRVMVFKADGGVVLPPAWAPRPDAAKIAKIAENDRLDLLLLERLVSNDAASLAKPQFDARKKPRADTRTELPFSTTDLDIEDRFAEGARMALA
eukprot:CAMPEP_0180200590 /NCGR_PEP_ID=MMETSP0987-20121128/6309_1 /TAXON_ID=697907 /ORGANISM="non described non described, Strain CCMP2293" /LENGTH=95 /DNA_ID=CAMNT_0022155723 /DNA_START=18 /DNA_END=305 /DNA_ORIENTATION=+